VTISIFGDVTRKVPMLATLIRYMTAFSFLALAGCSQMDPSVADGEVAPKEAALTGDAAEPLSQSPIRRALEAYRHGDFGLAERHFRAAVEHNPRDAKAWIGLAASYDQLRRFELADRAYSKAVQLSGETAQILNNQGYSLLLRGDLKAAQAKFADANQLRPGDVTVANNMKLIDSGGVKIPH
jgi:Flp pilus assembly protein TadD